VLFCYFLVFFCCLSLLETVLILLIFSLFCYFFGPFSVAPLPLKFFCRRPCHVCKQFFVPISLKKLWGLRSKIFKICWLSSNFWETEPKKKYIYDKGIIQNSLQHKFIMFYRLVGALTNLKWKLHISDLPYSYKTPYIRKRRLFEAPYFGPKFDPKLLSNFAPNLKPTRKVRSGLQLCQTTGILR